MTRTVILATVVSLLLIVALIGVNGILLSLTLPLVLALCAGIIQSSTALDISAIRTLKESSVTDGDAINVTLEIENNGGALTELQIIEEIPRRLSLLDGENRHIAPVADGESLTLNYALHGVRGDYAFADPTVIASDSLGLFSRKIQLAQTDHINFKVAPKVPRVGMIGIRPKSTRAFAGYIPARIAGTGIDFFGVRQYRAGDSLRHINWRAISRNPDSLFTNEFEQERVADVGLILDARQRAVTFAGTTHMLEYKIAAATAFSESLLSVGNRVSLLIYGSYLNWTLPGYGKLQQQKILRTLTGIKPGNSEVFATLEHFPTRLFPAQSQLIVISTLMPDDVAVLSRMRARGYSVMVISPDPVSFEFSLLPPTEATKAAARIANIERQLLLTQIQQTGVQVVDWNVDQPLKDLVRARLQRPVHQQQVMV